jgi:hypothetical protein
MIAVAIIMILVGALIYEAFDIHDPKPFLIDPEFLVIMCTGLLALCLSTTLAIRLLGFCLLVLEMGSQYLPELTSGLWCRYQTFEADRLLFSPPLSAISLRI